MRTPLTLGLVLLLAACESATAPAVRLSKEEAIAALRALQTISTSSAVGGALQEGQLGALEGSALRAPVASRLETLDVALDCPAGGRYEATLERGATSADRIVLLDLRERFIGCTVTESERSWRFDGAPALRTVITLRMADRVGTPTTMTTAYTGAFDVSSGATTGRCTVDLRSILEVETLSVRVEGTFCGQSITTADGVVLPSGLSLRR